ncbi:MAG: acylphosphatase [Clostridia bacterium]|nr:acylphosphatase [Clostridia bacterium]
MVGREGRIVRKRMTFHGSVQGVGFRYRARYAASAAGVTGWVRNEYDGSVTLELQGTEEQIGQVLEAILRGRFIDVESMDERILPLRDDERGFETVW